MSERAYAVETLLKLPTTKDVDFLNFALVKHYVTFILSLLKLSRLRPC